MNRSRARTRRTLMTAAIVLAAACPLLMGARPILDITGPNFRPFPLALVEAIPSGAADADAKLAKELIGVLKGDLEMSGLFKLIDPKSFITKPDAEGFDEGAIKWQEWADTGAEGLVKARVTQEKGKAVITLRLYEVGPAKMALEKTFELSADDARHTAHRFANEVVRYFTGEKGVFLTRILFVRKHTGSESISVIDVDGHGEETLVSNGAINLLPSWAPDGKSILYTSFINHNPDLYEYGFNSKLSHVVSNQPGLNIGAQTSPDGKKIALTLSRDDNSEIYLIDRQGKTLQRLTNDWGIDSSASWSPDGKKIAFVSTRSGNPHIYLMNADGSEQKRITFKGNYNQTPKWSPKGDRIAFTARDERNVFDLFTVDPNSGDIARLTQDQGNNDEPSWSPNGKYLVFTSTRGGSSQIYIMSADGLNQRKISSGKGECATPSWGPYQGEGE